MKKSIVFYSLLFFNLISLSSCSKKEDVYTYKLGLDSSLIEVNQYDYFDKSSLNVYKLTYLNDELIESSLTDEYSITLDNSKEIICNSYVFSEAGLFSSTISYLNYSSITLSIKVNASSNFSQKLVLNSLPNKTNYSINDNFIVDGLSISLSTEYYNSKNKKVSRVESISNYELYIEDISINEYKYTDYGLHRVNIKYKGIKSDLNLYFSTFCLKDSYSPILVEDKELLIEEDKTLNIDISNSSYSDSSVISPDEVEISYDLHTFSNKNLYTCQRYTPSRGEVPMLVIPVVIPGYEDLATKENYNVIEKTFFGSSNEINYESLHSYYYKSSYGQLDFSFLLTDYFYLETDSTNFNTISEFNGGNSSTIYNLSIEALAWAESTYNLDLKEFDSDNNGAIDSIWMVYMAPIKNRGDIFWAFSGFGNSSLNIDNPVSNTYGWISYEFLRGEYNDSENNTDKGVDAHVLIHETGHMLGLSDYYDTNKIDEVASNYDAVGRIDMMSNNVGDMSSYSKLMLGWSKPYVVFGNAKLSLKSQNSKDNIVLLFDDTRKKEELKLNSNNKYELNIFDEYILLDFYTNSGLNSKDYPTYNVYMPKEEGARIYHVDSRLTKVKYEGNTYVFDILDDPNSVLDYEEKDLYRGITNTFYETITLVGDNSFDEVRWISTNKKKLNYSSDNTNRIFISNNTFLIDSDDEQFISSKLNNSNSWSYNIKVN